jgi:thiol-disulfide isomerase/thioredoxin
VDIAVPASPKSRKLLQYVLFATVVVWIAVGFQEWNNDSGPLKAVGDRKPMSELVLPQLNGTSWRLADHQGQVVLINYWASWCAPCRQETPGLVKLAKEYQSKGLSVVGVALDEGGPKAIQSFVSQFHVGYPVLLPASLSPSSSSVEALPTTILVDPQGRAAKTYIGAVRESVFRADVDRLLAERAGQSPVSLRN